MYFPQPDRFGGSSRGADGPPDHRTAPGPLAPPAPREEFRSRENSTVQPPVAVTPRAETIRSKTEDQSVLISQALVADQVAAESPQAGKVLQTLSDLKDLRRFIDLTSEI